MNILAVGAHPDDIEFLCAGTLAKYSRNGHKVFMAHLCNGDMGGKEIEPEELARIRDIEAKEAASLIKAEALGPIAGDLDLYPSKEMRIKVVDIIRYAKPDVIFTHSPNDYMPDHVITSQLTFDAAFTATLPLYKTEKEFYEPIVPVFYMDTLAGLKFDPTDYVDITNFIDIKKEMLLCHKSQHKWIEGHHSTEAIGLLETMAKFRGFQCGCEYAEGFKKLDVWGRVKIENVLPE